MAATRTTPELLPDRSGYRLGEVRVDGFAHRADLPKGDQLQIARWAAQLRPEELSAEQRELLERSPARRPSKRRKEGLRQDRILSSPLVRALWRALDAEAQELVLNPDRRLGEGRRYPLSTGDLHELTGLSARQIQHGTDRRLLPFWTDARGHRRFEAAGAILAFSLAKSKQAERQYLATIATAEAPLAEMRKAVGMIGLYALTSPKASVVELEATQAQLRTLTEALDTALEHPGKGSAGLIGALTPPTAK